MNNEQLKPDNGTVKKQQGTRKKRKKISYVSKRILAMEILSIVESHQFVMPAKMPRLKKRKYSQFENKCITLGLGHRPDLSKKDNKQHAGIIPDDVCWSVIKQLESKYNLEWLYNCPFGEELYLVDFTQRRIDKMFYWAKTVKRRFKRKPFLDKSKYQTSIKGADYTKKVRSLKKKNRPSYTERGIIIGTLGVPFVAKNTQITPEQMIGFFKQDWKPYKGKNID